MLDVFWMPFGGSGADLALMLERALHVDPLSADIASKLGVDLAGGMALFSEDINPTFVVHLIAPDVAHAFFEHLREQGMQTHSMIVEGNDINTATIADGIDVSWAIDHDWLWVHLSIKLHPEEANAWFVRARHAVHATWTENFGWAKQLAEQLASHVPGLVGFIDSHAVLAKIVERAPKAAFACTGLLAPIGRVGIGVEGNGQHVGGRFSIDLGAAAKGVVADLLLPPPGFHSIAAPAALAVQWNLDLRAILGWFKPCADAAGIDMAEVTHWGIRTARVAVLTLDPSHDTGTGVASVDLSSNEFFADLLDKFPRRSMFESEHTYGTQRGHHLAIPFVMALDYVLDEHKGMVAIGDGLLETLVTGAPAAVTPLFAIDVRPPAMNDDAWAWMFGHLFNNERHGKIVTDHLMRWRDGHIAVSIEHDALVIDASGNRR